LLQEEDLAELNPPVPADTYKTQRGHLAVFAGSTGTSGAAWLCTHAAAHSKIGLVSLFADPGIYAPIAAEYKSIMIKQWQPGSSITGLERFSGFLVGPGWGIDETRKQWLDRLLTMGIPCVIDADGLNLLAQLCREKKTDLNHAHILTPHPGEFSRLAEIPVSVVLENPVEHVKQLSSHLNAIIVLKGHITYIASPGGDYSILDGMNPAMATAGSGDVLAGIIAAGLATGLKPYQAAKLGVLAHSLAGRQAYAQQGWFTAAELIPHVARILKVTQKDG
jgi:NAD(P)H-hydrate epimerase